MTYDTSIRLPDGQLDTRDLIYFIGASGSPIKIGQTQSVYNRLKTIQAHCWAPVSLLHKECFGDVNHEQIEKAAHDLLRDKNVIGEWFAVSLDEAIEAVHGCAGAGDILTATKQTKGKRGERHNDEFKALYKASPLSEHEIAKALSVSYDTVHCWNKPRTSKNSTPCPLWALEKLKSISP